MTGSMKSMLSGYVLMALNLYETTEKQNQEWKDKIMAEWIKSKNYPRKKKKRVRKECNLNWSFANYNPYKMF